MELKKLGNYKKPLKGTEHDLSKYSVDSSGQVWTANEHTYFTRFGRSIRQSEGQARTVTLRDVNGKKVSISRSKLREAFVLNKTVSF